MPPISMRSTAVYSAADAASDAEALAIQRDLSVDDVRAYTSKVPCFRDVAFSPEGSHLSVLFEDRMLRVFRVVDNVLTPRSTRPVLTSAPAIDTAWCPFMDAADDSTVSLLAAAQGVPLQMHDLDDGTVRASYIARGAMDEVLHPTSCLWPGDGSSVIGGYNKGRVVVYDVARPGDLSLQNFESRIVTNTTGAVTALAASPKRPIVAAGNRLGCIELFDTRGGHPIAFIASTVLRGAVTQVSFDPEAPFRLLSTARGASAAGIVEHDIRFVRRPLMVYGRPSAETNQKHGFAIVPSEHRKAFHNARIIAASPRGGVIGYKAECGHLPPAPPLGFQTGSDNTKWTAAVALANGDLHAPTSGISFSAANGRPLVAVSVGSRPTGIRCTYEERAPAGDDGGDAVVDAMPCEEEKMAAAVAKPENWSREACVRLAVPS